MFQLNQPPLVSWQLATKKKDISEVVTARNLFAKKNTVSAINKASYAQIFANVKNVKIMKFANLIPMNKCLKFKKSPVNQFHSKIYLKICFLLINQQQN